MNDHPSSMKRDVRGGTRRWRSPRRSRSPRRWRTPPGFIHPAAFLFIFLALFLAGCRSNPKPTASPTPSQATAVQELPVLPRETATPAPLTLANGWYQYADPVGGFSFGYPTDAIVTAGQNPVDGSKNILIQFLIPDQPYQGMSIRIEPNPQGLTAANFARQLYEKSAQKPAAAAFADSLQTLQVGGVSAVQAVIPSSNTELTVIVPYNVEVYIISPVHDTAAIKVAPETLELFHQVLDTIKFGSP